MQVCNSSISQTIENLGNLAAWLRLKYPDLVSGAISSSAPIQAIANFTGLHLLYSHITVLSSPTHSVHDYSNDFPHLFQTCILSLNPFFVICLPRKQVITRNIQNVFIPIW